MTRTTPPDLDDLPLPPFGHPERRNPNQPANPPQRRRRDDDLPPGFERGPDGRLRTVDIPGKS